MRVVIGYCSRDEDQASRLADWIRDLGPYPGHTLLVARDNSSHIRPFSNVGFDKVDEIEITNDAWKHWPESCNNVFGITARHIQALMGAEPFLWLEPDVVPLRTGWISSIEAEYRACGHPFLGDFVSVHTPELDVPDHMSGIAVYPGFMQKEAGAALNCHEIAWDVAAAYQIVPRMATSKLIMHAWKHPPFTSYNDVEGEIYAHKPECVLFHADKSGTLIELLRQQKAGVVGHPLPCADPSPALPIGATPVCCDILIKSYPPDFERLRYCLSSIEKFARGFRRVVLVVPTGSVTKEHPFGPAGFVMGVTTIEVVEHGEGYLYQQVVKSNAHQFTDAEYILHIDSDCILTKPITPQTFFRNGKPYWLYTPYAKIETPWQPITEKFMREGVDYEFMRRLPMLVPRSLHIEMANFCLARHGMRTEDYILTQPGRDFSEFNALGAVAWTRAHDDFTWIDTHDPKSQMPEVVAIQEFSRGEFTDQRKAEFEAILSGNNLPVPVLAEPENIVADLMLPSCSETKNGEAQESTTADIRPPLRSDSCGGQNLSGGSNGVHREVATESLISSHETDPSELTPDKLEQFWEKALPIIQNTLNPKLAKQRAAAANARATLAAKRAAGWRPTKKRRKRRKVAV